MIRSIELIGKWHYMVEGLVKSSEWLLNWDFIVKLLLPRSVIAFHALIW